MFPMGHELLLFRPRRVRPVVEGGEDLAEMQIGEEMRWVHCTRSDEYCGRQLFVFR